MEIDVKDEQPKNASSPMDVTEFGISIDVKDVLPNANSSIAVNEFGITIEVKDSHS